MIEQRRKEVVQQLIHKRVLVTPQLVEQLKQPEVLEEYYRKYCAPVPAFSVRSVEEYEPVLKKHSVGDFVGYFNTRFKALEKLLRTRQELSGLTSIARLQHNEGQSVSIIGMIVSKDLTKNEHFIMEVEDRTGSTKVLISKSSEVYEQAKDLMPDEVIGISGTTGNDILFANLIVLPDIPIRDSKVSGEEGYALVLSDIHLGHKDFLRQEFESFLDWINGDAGSAEQQEIASKTKYVIVAGDLVDGIGIHPNQKQELEIPDIYDQYKECAKLLSRIPSHMKLVLIPGNHDAMRLSEPQPRFDTKFAAPLWDLPNATICTNPSTINIHSSDRFAGYDFLLYHGFSYSYYMDNVYSIRNSGKPLSDRTDLVMKYLLRRRHLAPTHGSSLYIPDPLKDGMFIGTIPDFFLSGHIHKPAIAKYRGVDMVVGSCWQSQSEYQEKMGHVPVPCKVPVINLANRDINMLDFSL